MAIFVNFNGQTIYKPGAYSSLTPSSSNTTVPAIGTVALIGEAEQGLPFSSEKGLSAVTYGPDELQLIRDKYGAGPLVDAASSAIKPSNDPQISGGAQELLLLKTNQSTQASLTIHGSGGVVYGVIADPKIGESGNLIQYSCSAAAGNAAQRNIQITKEDGTVVSDTIGGTALFTLSYTGPADSVTLSITDKAVSTTTLTSGTAIVNDLNIAITSIPAAQRNIAGLCALINNQNKGYTATPATSAAGTYSLSRMDQVSGLTVKSGMVTSASVNQDAYEVAQFFQNAGLSFTASVMGGLPGLESGTLSGGSTGATSMANIIDCFDSLLKRRVNFIVPLFSRDASEDVNDGLTDPASAYDVLAVHAATVAHVNYASSTLGRNERQAWVGYKGTWADTVEAAAKLNSYRVSLCFQDVDTIAADGSNVVLQPHALAAIAAGMHAAAPVGLSTTFKAPNVIGVSHTEFDPATMGTAGIQANLTFVEQGPAGTYRFALDNNTYASDNQSWIYNRPSVVFAGDFAAYAIRLTTENFVGQRNSDVGAETVKNTLVSVFDTLRSLGVIVADNNTSGRGYKDLVVTIQGSQILVSVTLALVENIEFVLNRITVQRAG